jgi:hypothetical protein
MESCIYSILRLLLISYSIEILPWQYKKDALNLNNPQTDVNFMIKSKTDIQKPSVLFDFITQNSFTVSSKLKKEAID